MPTNPPGSSRPWLAGQAQYRRPKGEHTDQLDVSANDRELVLTRLMGLFFDITLGLLAVTEGA